MTYAELSQTLKSIAERTNVIGFDFVEVNPQLYMSVLASLPTSAPTRSWSFSVISALSRAGPSAAMRSWRSGVEEPARQRAGDDVALDLRGALVDPHDAAVADVALQTGAGFIL